MNGTGGRPAGSYLQTIYDRHDGLAGYSCTDPYLRLSERGGNEGSAWVNGEIRPLLIPSVIDSFLYLFCLLFGDFIIIFICTKWVFHGNLWAKRDHLIETSYLKAHPFGNRYPEWMPNLHSDGGQDSSLCARGSQGPQSTSGSTIPRCAWLCEVSKQDAVKVFIVQEGFTTAGIYRLSLLARQLNWRMAHHFCLPLPSLHNCTAW